jgi:hypothetical protein
MIAEFQEISGCLIMIHVYQSFILFHSSYFFSLVCLDCHHNGRVCTMVYQFGVLFLRMMVKGRLPHIFLASSHHGLLYGLI